MVQGRRETHGRWEDNREKGKGESMRGEDRVKTGQYKEVKMEERYTCKRPGNNNNKTKTAKNKEENIEQ